MGKGVGRGKWSFPMKMKRRKYLHKNFSVVLSDWNYSQNFQQTQKWVVFTHCPFYLWYIYCSSVGKSCPTLCDPMGCSTQASLSITNSWSLLKLMSIEPVMPSNYLILCSPLLLPPSIFPSIRVFSSESALRIRWPKYWFQLQHQSFQWTLRTDFLQVD